MGGFEPPTTASQTRCASQLRYTPQGDVSIMRTMHGSQAPWRLVFLAAVSLALWMLLAGLSGCREVTHPDGPPPPVTPSPTLSFIESPTPAPSLSSAPRATGTPACSPGRIEAVDIPTSHLADPLHASIYLPPCYSEEQERHYPVLYLFHGLGDTDQQWIRLGAPSTASRLILADQVPPFLIVMPYDPKWLEPNQYGFEAAVIEDLLPFVDSHYRTLPDPADRAVGGLSRGSGWALHFGLSHPELFGAIGAHSVVLFGSDGMMVNKWLAGLSPQSMPRIFLDIGDHDRGLAGAEILEAQLTAANIPHEWHLNMGYHTDSYWSAHVEAYLRWYAAGW